MDLEKYFNNPKNKRQKQYEAIRAFVIDGKSAEEVARKYGYTTGTVYTYVRNAKAGKSELFPQVKMGPQKRRTSKELQQIIVGYRNKKLSSKDIHTKLQEDGSSVSVRTIERILRDTGYEKLKRRTNKELGLTSKKKIIPERSNELNFKKLEPFNVDCPVVGVYFFLPYILESGIIEIVRKCNLPSSSVIGSVSACLSMLLLKLIGNERLSNMDRFNQEPGLGVFSGLNILPKSGYMNSYSCRTSEAMLLKFQKEIITQFRKKYPELYRSDFINLDFHSIPHFGDESEMEKIWCGARGKTLKGANTVFAQDSKSNLILYARADILRREESAEIEKFVSYWKSIKGRIDETLVFDCKFTKYEKLDELTADGIKFITLRQRGKKLIKRALSIPNKEWKRIKLPIPKRKHRKVSVYEEEVILKGCNHKFRQIIVKDHGRELPTFIISNNQELTLMETLIVYAKRWHIENKLAEFVSFFNLNSLSSPLMIRIHFDILWTLIADTIYRRFAQDLRRFEKTLAPTIFKKFIDMPGRVIYDGNKFIVKIRKRAHTPVLLGVESINKPIILPWLENKILEINWTA